MKHTLIAFFRALLGFSFAVVAVLPAQAQPAPFDTALDPEARHALVESVLARLDASYVYPETARAMALDVRAREQAGAYDALDDARALADSLTAHLRAVSHDKHLSVFVSPRPLPEVPPDPARDPDVQQRMDAQLRFLNYGFDAVQRLDGNVGYMKLRGFAPASGDGAKEIVAQVMGVLSRTDALIIDLRDNQGGEPEMVQLISSYLFGDEPVHLNSLYWRAADRTEEFWTDDTVAGPRYGPDRPVYVLTSSQTFSAAEEFAYNLQQLKRATVVGETTGGGAHDGDVQRVTEHVGMWMPMARAINPVTGTNWEGVGVVPDVAAGASEALATAHTCALQHLLSQTDHPGLQHALQAALDAIESAK